MIALVNGCVLFPHAGVWSRPINHKRIWETEISESLPGSEARQAVRAVARRQIEFSIIPTSLAERVRFESRIDAASVSGFACAPIHGRACRLANAAAAGAGSVTLAASVAWTFQAGDYVVMLRDDQTFDVQPVVGVAGSVLNFGAGVLTYAWVAGVWIWPLIFGKFLSAKESAINPGQGLIKITIQETVSNRSVQIGATPAAVLGVGQAAVGSTLLVG